MRCVAGRERMPVLPPCYLHTRITPQHMPSWNFALVHQSSRVSALCDSLDWKPLASMLVKLISSKHRIIMTRGRHSVCASCGSPLPTGERFNNAALRGHEDTCPARPEKCHYGCTQWVPRRDMRAHRDVCVALCRPRTPSRPTANPASPDDDSLKRSNCRLDS